MTDPRVLYVIGQLRFRGIVPNDWEKRVSCCLNITRDFPQIEEWTNPEEVIRNLFKGFIHPILNMENIEKKEAEDTFNFWGVPRPVWQLLVAIANEQKNPDQVG